MATGNRHKVTVKTSVIPSFPDNEDRGYDVCCEPFLVLASLTEGDRYHNDITGVVQKLYDNADTATWTLEFDGNDVSPIGVDVTFPNEEFVSAFVIDWRQHLAITGTGCYRVRCDYDINGVTGTYYEGTYDLKPWTIETARDTVRVFSIYNDLSRAKQINFADSGFANSIRFAGMFGLMQPNMEITNLTSVEFVQRKIENENMKSFELEMHPTTECYTSRLLDEHLLHANEIYISDHNATNHSWNYRDLPVILKKETTPTFEYAPGSRLAGVKATFEEKVLVSASQYAGSLQSGQNASFVLIGSAGPIGMVTVTNSNGTYSVQVAPGGTLVLPDTTINVNVDGVLDQTTTFSTLDPSVTVNIDA